jgi:acyl dehydratase
LIWWEDFKVGDAAELGRHTFTEDEIMAFARQFDPQAFHIDRSSAEKTVFGGLIEVKHPWEAVNQHGELVLTMEGWGFFGRKN